MMYGRSRPCPGGNGRIDRTTSRGCRSSEDQARVSAISLVPLLGLIGFPACPSRQLGQDEPAQRLRDGGPVALAVRDITSAEIEADVGGIPRQQGPAPDALQASEASRKAVAALTAYWQRRCPLGGPDLAAVAALSICSCRAVQGRTDVSARSGNAADLTAATRHHRAWHRCVGVVERSGWRWTRMSAGRCRPMARWTRQGAGRARARAVSHRQRTNCRGRGADEADRAPGGRLQSSRQWRSHLPQHKTVGIC